MQQITGLGGLDLNQASYTLRDPKRLKRTSRVTVMARQTWLLRQERSPMQILIALTDAQLQNCVDGGVASLGPPITL